MRFTSVFVAGTFAILAAAQSSEVTTVPDSVASPTVSLTPAQSSQYACVAACDEGDVNCQAKCVPVSRTFFVEGKSSPTQWRPEL